MKNPKKKSEGKGQDALNASDSKTQGSTSAAPKSGGNQTYDDFWDTWTEPWTNDDANSWDWQGYAAEPTYTWNAAWLATGTSTSLWTNPDTRNAIEFH